MTISTIHFPGLTALPLYVGVEKNFFKERDVEVSLTAAKNSRELMVGLLSGDYEVGQAAIDNLIAYKEGQAASELSLDRDLIGIMATSSTNLDLVVRPEVGGFEGLRGKRLGVDALTTGFSFVLRKMLERRGLVESEYTLVAVGGDTARIAALKQREIAGALLAKDFSTQASQEFGAVCLADSLQILGKYQGTCVFTRRETARLLDDELVRFLAALRRAHAWIFDSQNTAEAASILADRANGLSISAASLVRQLENGRGGLSQTGRFDVDELKVVLSLRSQYGTPKRTLDDPFRYVDMSYLDRAEL